MFENFSKNSIYNKDYNYFSVKNFFGGRDDPSRLIILIFILLSFVLNVIIIYILSFYRKKRDFSLSGSLTLNILIVNFLHTLSYILNWIIRNDEINNDIENNNSDIEVGALLKGNPSDFGFCQAQGFLLIFLSLSQDIIIIIFLAFINIEKRRRKKFLASIILILGGYISPLLITIYFYYFDLIGISEKFCYISKYLFSIDNGTNEVLYEKENNYKSLISIIFALRFSSFILAIILVRKAFNYIKIAKNPDKKKEILKYSLPVVLVAFFTLCMDLIFKIISIIDNKLEEKYIEIYVVLSSIDSILLPLAFSIRHNIYIYFCCCFRRNNFEISSINESDNEISIKDLEIDEKLLMSENESKNKLTPQ